MVIFSYHACMFVAHSGTGSRDIDIYSSYHMAL